MREAEEGERLRFPESTLLPVLGGVPTEFQQPRLVGMQFQGELREALAQRDQEPFRIVTELKAHDEVVCVPHDEHVAAGLRPPPPMDPEVEHVVQIHVRQERRCDSLNAKGNFRFERVVGYR